MKKIFALTVIAIAASAMDLVSCSKADSNEEKVMIELSTKGKEIAEDGQSFASKLLLDLRSSNSYIVSPLSLQMVLSMLLEGAEGESKEELLSVLNVASSDVDEVRDYCKKMLEGLASIDRNAANIYISNASFLLEGLTLSPDYANILNNTYKTSHYKFSNINDLSAKAKEWAKNKTKGEIADFKVQPTEYTKMLLLNALYFNGKWAKKFNPDNSGPEKFTPFDESTIQVTMMKQKGAFSGIELDGFKGVSLPYGDGAFEMDIYLPDSNEKMDSMLEFFAKWGFPLSNKSGTHYEDVDLWIPKFETRTNLGLNGPLQRLGLEKVFDEKQADFSGILKDKTNLWIDEIAQSSVIKVDESGTVAASVSKAKMSGDLKNIPMRMVFHANHPFVYLISETRTGAILFAGQYTAK